MRENRERVYLDMAHVLSRRSTCRRRRVGAILAAADGTILGLGYNGVPSGWSHCTDKPCRGIDYSSGSGLEVCQAIHAEQNALMRCTDISAIDMAVVTTFPCLHCQKLLLNTPCRIIVYSEPYGENPIWDRETMVIMP